MKSNVQKYLQLRSELKATRAQESDLLEKMDLLWQAMTLEEREEIKTINPSWPPPALRDKREEEEND